MRRGDTVSILPAYTTAGYLPCTGIKKGYYSKEDILNWLIDRLLPLCNEYPGERSIIVLDNVSVHVDPRIIEAIAVKYFKQSTAGYIFDGEIEAFERDLEHLTMEITE